MSTPRWKQLSRYSACDIADALLKLKVPGAGFLADLTPIPHPASRPNIELRKTLGPASTFLFVPKATPSFPSPAPMLTDTPPSNVEDNTPFSDYTQGDTIVLVSQPAGQSCAVVGGIMGARMKVLGAQSIIVNGRVRDLEALGGLGLPVWSKGTSIIGMGAEAKFHAKEVAIRIGDVSVEPGDIVMVDPFENGVVVVPKGRVDEVLGMLPGMVEADERVIKDVEAGTGVKEAFKKHRT
ncbi:DlpA domain-containing protein [Melanomma pulvis-pyrius CBS 109.77]|uniref:DlpA domain-containing protein n=1 Tax=Melanomma pulvis-pyrius CBS 109.77 TaxID=1314802 RepID=A0A6A6XPL6_9PLEO|nr:DlpA domain-containing protein [Melanomma pulvis-pyrius CBS 109.77]